MIIYKAVITLNELPCTPMIRQLATHHCEGRGFNRSDRYYLTDVSVNRLTVCQIIRPGADAEAGLCSYLTRLSVPFDTIKTEQISILQLAECLTAGSQNQLCPEMPKVFQLMHMMPFVCDPYNEGIDEATFQPIGPAAIIKKSKELYSSAFSAELERIQAGKGKLFCGHPVLYSIVTDTSEKNERISDLLFAALYRNGRLAASRVCILQPYRYPLPEFILKDTFLAQEGAAVVVDLRSAPETPDIAECLNTVERLARANRNKVLTVFRSFSGDVAAGEFISRVAGTVPVVSLTEDRIDAAHAKKYLTAKIRAAGYSCAHPADILPENGCDYSEQQLLELFDSWQNRHLCTEVYPQYADMLPPDPKTQEKLPPESSALQQLQQLVGLAEVKQLVGQAVDYIRLQQLYRERGLPTAAPHLHMVFTGNPGTAKTTVARLIARIFKECGVLSKGELIEVGRGELIGRYVGWTANMVNEKFQQAKGSVLFIDEAYSLLDGGNGNLFGDEAINAIVQQMENTRDDTVVIFAGYREPMQQFLDRNPGLRSRISYNLHFADYSEQELFEILQLQLAVANRSLDPHAEQKIKALLHEGSLQPNFGNGRYVRRLLERALLAQASRLARQNPVLLSDEQLQCLTDEDFIPEAAPSEPPRRTIGFCA